MMITTIGREGKTTCDLNSYFFTNKRTIFLKGTIDDDLATDIIQQILYLSDINKNPITLQINSPGGSVSAGLAIYDVLKSSGCRINTICSGIAASMGAFLLAAGTPGYRFCYPNGEVMIHQVLGGAYGQASNIEIAANHILKTRNRMNTLLAEMTGQALEKIQTDTDRDYYMNADQALAYGIIDHIGIGTIN